MSLWMTFVCSFIFIWLWCQGNLCLKNELESAPSFSLFWNLLFEVLFPQMSCLTHHWNNLGLEFFCGKFFTTNSIYFIDIKKINYLFPYNCALIIWDFKGFCTFHLGYWICEYHDTQTIYSLIVLLMSVWCIVTVTFLFLILVICVFSLFSWLLLLE